MKNANVNKPKNHTENNPKVSELLRLMFTHELWQEMIDKANSKKIDMVVVKRLCEPEERVRLFYSILMDEYEIAPPHIARIPKDVKGEYREVYVNEGVDRIVLTLINDCLNKLFPDMIHPTCKSYQKGIGTQEVVQTISKKIVKLNGNTNKHIHIGYKADLSKYFDSVKIEIIDQVFDIFEDRLGFEHGTEPVINILRRYYHNDYVFDIDGILIQQYSSLKQGCAVAAMLANVVLYDVDEVLSKMDIIYYRYSDDIVMIGKDAEKAKQTLENMLSLYGLKLNPKKVEPLYSDQWFKFLGFNIKGSLITLSKNRIKKFQKEIVKRTLDKPNVTYEQARKNIVRYLYDGEHSWASSCLGTINVPEDIHQMNLFIMDCLRAVKVRETQNRKSKINLAKIGGLGVCYDRGDYTIVRGTGKNVARNRLYTDIKLENYFTMGCLHKHYKYDRSLFSCSVRTMNM